MLGLLPQAPVLNNNPYSANVHKFREEGLAGAFISTFKNPNLVTHPNIGSSVLVNNENVYTVSLRLQRYCP